MGTKNLPFPPFKHSNQTKVINLKDRERERERKRERNAEIKCKLHNVKTFVSKNRHPTLRASSTFSSPHVMSLEHVENRFRFTCNCSKQQP
ncbi:hypothetical protein T4B_11545 [Trichinella pseudospiralis]|uniref:Uncharacterized protein n=1 Tax=Trichinella pseudospiralis TaxID=6337 RepID=A0A0V1IVU7_TRIPS|nr:hypothetical protein T4B_11545 [Trichinella pseudospiralis]KRZ40287.1 hypothetical protein T4C_5964 [Trichinella pseudospiralis]